MFWILFEKRTHQSQSYATFIRHSAVLNVLAVLLRKLLIERTRTVVIRAKIRTAMQSVKNYCFYFFFSLLNIVKHIKHAYFHSLDQSNS